MPNGSCTLQQLQAPFGSHHQHTFRNIRTHLETLAKGARGVWAHWLRAGALAGQRMGRGHYLRGGVQVASKLDKGLLLVQLLLEVAGM